MIAGIDSHKHTLACCVVDEAGRKRVGIEVANSPKGHLRLVQWLAGHQVVLVGLECSGTYGHRAGQALVQAGFDVREVPGSMTARERGRLKSMGKSDPRDALAIARTAARERTALAGVKVNREALELQRLLAHQRHLAEEKTRLLNRVHYELVLAHPGVELPAKQLIADRSLLFVRDISDPTSVSGRLIHHRVARLLQIKRELLDLRKEIGERMAARHQRLLAIQSCGPLTAAAIVGQVNDIDRFRNRNAFAAGNGTAPIPASSGITNRHRLNRRGDRQINRAITLIALGQLRTHPPARTYFDKKLAEGKTKKDALRALKRRISDVVYRAMAADAATALDIT